MSNATARPSSPARSSSAVQSVEEPGLPWTNRTAYFESPGPASINGERSPATTTSPSRGISTHRRRRDGWVAAKPGRTASRAQVGPDHPGERPGGHQLLRGDPAAAHLREAARELPIARCASVEQLFHRVELVSVGVCGCELLVAGQALAMLARIRLERPVDICV